MESFCSFADLICTIPGIGDGTAEVIVAETGADMSEAVRRLTDAVDIALDELGRIRRRLV